MGGPPHDPTGTYVCVEWNISALILNPSCLLTLAKLKDSGDACLYVPVPHSHIHLHTGAHEYLFTYIYTHTHTVQYMNPLLFSGHTEGWWKKKVKKRKIKKARFQDSMKGSWLVVSSKHVSDQKEGKQPCSLAVVLTNRKASVFYGDWIVLVSWNCFALLFIRQS